MEGYWSLDSSTDPLWQVIGFLIVVGPLIAGIWTLDSITDL